MRNQRIALLLFLLLTVAWPLAAQNRDEDAKKRAEYIQASYTKYELKIPVRDGVKLFTVVYVPKDDSRSYGILLKRTPYGVRPYGVDHYPSRLGPSEKLARAGFIFVYQDVRGRFLSEGKWLWATPHQPDKSGPSDVDESSDTYDTIDYLVAKVPNNNGKVGIWGISYPGFYAAAGMIDAHPALVAASPQAPVTDLFRGDDSFHNGAFCLAANFGFLTFFSEQLEPARPQRRLPFEYKTHDGYEFFLGLGPLSQANEKYFHGENPYWNHMVEHTTYDEFWQSRSLDLFIRNVPPAVLTVGGWYDAEDGYGPLKVFRGVEENDPDAANHLVMGPWSHGGWAHGDGDRLGDVRFGSKTSEFYRDNIELAFFDYHLNGKGENDLAKASIFETGTNQWRKFDAWPPTDAESRRLYFRAGGKLSFEPPAEEEASDEYLSDPSRPVPFVDFITQNVPRRYIVGDQRFASKRPDVLVYTTEVLERDVTLCGPVSPDLWVSTTGTDSDFVVKLIDVYPDDYPEPERGEGDARPSAGSMGGYQQLVRGDPIRAKFRHSLEKPEPMVPGELTRLRFTMPGICHAFRPGHRIMVQVQSSWFPLFDRNPQVFVDIPNAKPEDFQKATQRLSRSRGKGSSIQVLVRKPGM
jgi:putative CocE/NonD family hydrolase